MKKFLSLFLSISLILSLFAGMFAFAAGEAISVPEDGSAVALDLEKAQLTTYNGSVTVKLSKGQVKLSNEAEATEENFLDNAQTGDCAEWNVNFPKAGNYKIEISASSMDGVGVIASYLNGKRMYAAGGFEAYGYGKARIYNNTATLYVTAEEAGEATLSIYFEALGVNILTPKISYFEGEIPAQPAFDKLVSSIQTDGFTNNPTKALLLDEDTFYGLHVNVASPFTGIVLPQWTPGGGKGHCKFELSIYNWDEDEDKTIEGTPVATKEFTTPGDCIMICKFDEAIPAGNYYIYFKCIELMLDEGANHTSGLQMHMKTGLPLELDDYFDYYFEAYTNIADYVEVPGRMAYVNFVVDDFVEQEDFFLELYEGEPEKDPEEDPTKAPTKAPATLKPTPTKGSASESTTAPSKDNANDEGDNMGMIITIIAIAGVVVVAAVVAVVVIVKKKK